MSKDKKIAMLFSLSIANFIIFLLINQGFFYIFDSFLFSFIAIIHMYAIITGIAIFF